MQTVAPQISLRDIAQKAQVHVSTVSRALNNDPKLPESTRNRLQTLAREMGYQRQPLFAAMAQRRRVPRREQGVPVVFVTHLPYERIGSQGFHLAGAEERAKVFGYRVSEERIPRTPENFPPPEWRHRGVAGLLIGPWLGHEQALLDADLSEFSVVQCGNTWCDAGYHAVRSAAFLGVKRCYDKLKEKGYRRIGFCLIRHDPPHPDDFEREAAAHECLIRDGLLEALPILWERPGKGLDRLASWVQDLKLDAVIGLHGGIRTRLKDLGFAIPRDLAFAQLLLTPHNPRNTSGIRAADIIAGSTAIELLDTMIRHGERGRPEQRRITVIDAIWHEGVTSP